MDKHLLRKYIEAYKLNFNYVNQQELYKWEAVKCFQDNWNIDASDFFSMISVSLIQTENLLKSGQYFPLRMILHYSQRKPNTVRELFRKLYDEDIDLYTRIVEFQSGTQVLHDKLFPDRKNTYQDHRAIIVYLSLRFPERYFFYKFEMYKQFADKLKLLHKPIAGRKENIGQFNAVCRQIKYELSQDQGLIKLHKGRISNHCYYDENLHILTQDFIYAVVRHLSPISLPASTSSNTATKYLLTTTTDVIVSSQPVSLVGRVVNFIENSIENKRIGDLGELWVIRHEKDKLLKLNKHKLSEQVRHISREEGDGTGYDVLSYDEVGRKLFIEVKTTKGSKNTAFYITRNELERSKIENANYFLYRLYNFNEETNTADILVIKGDLTGLCEVPVLYKIGLVD